MLRQPEEDFLQLLMTEKNLDKFNIRSIIRHIFFQQRIYASIKTSLDNYYLRNLMMILNYMTPMSNPLSTSIEKDLYHVIGLILKTIRVTPTMLFVYHHHLTGAYRLRIYP